METHSNILAWRIPLTDDPGGLPSMDHIESDTTEVTAHTYAWPQNKLGDQEIWPENGLLNCNAILQLDVFCKKEGE